MLHVENVSCFVNLCNICEIGDGHSDECPYCRIFGFKLTEPNRRVSKQLAAFISRVGDLTLRLLMSYIYIYIYMEHLFLMFLDHTRRRTTVGRTPLDE